MPVAFITPTTKDGTVLPDIAGSSFFFPKVANRPAVMSTNTTAEKTLKASKFSNMILDSDFQMQSRK